MERNIKFRGQDENGKWLYGGYYTLPDGEGGSIHRIAADYSTKGKFEFHDVVVKPETVGQFTGLTDRNEKKIYEDDIVEWQQYSFTGQKTETIKGVVYFDTDCGAYGLRTDLVEDFFWLKIFYNEVDLGDITVIGNIHDNPELLKKETVKEADH